METEIFWKAVEAKDAKFDGAFVFAVKTTGIFCRPSCRSKTAKRENVEFFDAPVRAERNGFRACLRCRPKDATASDTRVTAVLAACDLIKDDPEMTLEDMAATLKLSASHLQRTFKEIIGISPKKFAEGKKIERFKNEVRSGSDVTTAMYEAGFGSSRGLYEKAAANLGMTPATYKKGGAGMKINYVITNCEIGKLLVARTKRGICSVTFGDSDAALVEGLEGEFANAEVTDDDEGLKTAVDAILKYLAGKEKRLILPLDLQATAFQLQVWDILRTIPYGETRSYSQVAEALGDKKKVRAVARACATNRVAVVIPCHRVVASDGKLSGYRWGVERKKALLEKERSA